jgi:hypothetical protein
MKTKSTMKILTTVIWASFATATLAETNREIQAVDEDGNATYTKVNKDFADTNYKVIIQGIVLNNPEEILDSSISTVGIGGQWQIIVQGLDGDHAGTAVWMGENYAAWISTSSNYTDEKWLSGELSELTRVNYDNGHHIRKGDKVQITGFAMQYMGKTNINERHRVADALNFTVDWLDETLGLPEPEVITLANVKESSDVAIFDSSRLKGGEYYQGCLVRINGVKIKSGTFAANGTIVITDGIRTLNVKLGLDDEFNTDNLTSSTSFDVVGIFDQEGSDFKGNYRLWVTTYDGSSKRLGIFPTTPGDANGDGIADVKDLSLLAANYGKTSGATWSMGDFNDDSAVNVQDLSVLAANYNSNAGNKTSWAEAYAQAFGTTDSTDTASTDSSSDEATDTVCSSLGLSLIAVLAIMGLSIVKIEE